MSVLDKIIIGSFKGNRVVGIHGRDMNEKLVLDYISNRCMNDTLRFDQVIAAIAMGSLGSTDGKHVIDMRDPDLDCDGICSIISSEYKKRNRYEANLVTIVSVYGYSELILRLGISKALSLLHCICGISSNSDICVAVTITENLHSSKVMSILKQQMDIYINTSTLDVSNDTNDTIIDVNVIKKASSTGKVYEDSSWFTFNQKLMMIAPLLKIVSDNASNTIAAANYDNNDATAGIGISNAGNSHDHSHHHHHEHSLKVTFDANDPEFDDTDLDDDLDL